MEFILSELAAAGPIAVNVPPFSYEEGSLPLDNHKLGENTGHVDPADTN